MNGHHSSVELQQLRYVVAIAEEKNFTRAAERCFVVQSSLSHQIKALERELGVQLFARSSRRVELTPAGEVFLVHARACLAAAERGAAEAAGAGGQVRGTLTVGVIPTVTAIDIPAVLGEFHRAHPAVRISLASGGSDQFMAAIKAGRMDVAVLGLAESALPQGVATKVLATERLVAVLPKGHELTGRESLQLSDLAPEVFADFPAGTPGREQSDLAFRAIGEHREVAFEAQNTTLILQLVAQGLVVALLPPGAIPVGFAGVRTVEVANGPTRREYLAWSSFNPSPAARAFVDSIARPASGLDGP